MCSSGDGYDEMGAVGGMDTGSTWTAGAANAVVEVAQVTVTAPTVTTVSEVVVTAANNHQSYQQMIDTANLIHVSDPSVPGLDDIGQVIRDLINRLNGGVDDATAVHDRQAKVHLDPSKYTVTYDPFAAGSNPHKEWFDPNDHNHAFTDENGDGVADTPWIRVNGNWWYDATGDGNWSQPTHPNPFALKLVPPPGW